MILSSFLLLYYFQFAAIISKTAMDIHVQAFLWTYAFILLSKYLGDKWVCYTVDIELTFKETAVFQFHIPTISVWGLQLLCNPHQHLVWSVFFILAILVVIYYYNHVLS